MNDSRRAVVAPAILVAVYLVASIALLLVWNARGVYSVTGDEPHYLVMSDALISHHTLELTQAYRDEFTSRAIYASGLGPAGAEPDAPYAQVIYGPHGGRFSWHGPGISAIVAIPFALGGVLGAKLALIVLGAAVVLLAWWISGLFLSSRRARTAAVLTVAVAYPLVPASAQIYPDLYAGVIALLVVAVLLRRERRWGGWALGGISLAIGVLPWLMTKFAPAAAISLAAVVWMVVRQRRGETGSQSLAKGLAAALAPAGVLYALLAAWNAFTFGSPIGGNPNGGLQASVTALMVLGGHLLDQNQGILIQNVALWVGVFGLGSFCRRDRWAFTVWALIFASIWIPGAMHPGWYGGGSFFGRYSWALALLMIIPTMAGFAAVRAWSTKAFAAVVTVAVVWNLLHVLSFAFLGGGSVGTSYGVDLYTKDPDVWLENYAAFVYPLHGWFPALYNADWAFTFAPNAAWLLLLVAVAVAGWRPRIGLVAAAVAATLVLVAGFLGTPGPRTTVQAGSSQASTEWGYVAEGPWQDMRLGTYDWSVTYAATAPSDVVTGRWELVERVTGTVAASGELHGTDGHDRTETMAMPIRALEPKPYLLRIASYGQGEFVVRQTAVTHA